MRKKGKIVVWMLIAALLCGQMPMQAFAQEMQAVRSVSDGDADLGMEALTSRNLDTSSQ